MIVALRGLNLTLISILFSFLFCLPLHNDHLIGARAPIDWDWCLTRTHCFSLQTHQDTSAQLKASVDAEQLNDSWKVAVASPFWSTIGILIPPHASF